MYRYNLRKMNDATRFTLTLQNVEGRLTYKNLIKKPVEPETKPVIVYESDSKNYRRPVIQYKDGKMIAQYPSMIEAAKITGAKVQGISKVVRGLKFTSGGFGWKYA
jgi:hypothetical protein